MNEAIYKQPLVLFLGAGASASLGLKTTVQFFEWLKSDQQVYAPFLDFIADHITPSEQIGSNLDVEVLLDYLEKVIEGKELLEKEGAQAQFRFYDFEEYIKLRERIKDLVVDHYSRFDKKSAFSLNRRLILRIAQAPGTLSIFTTNYDLVIEETMSKLKSSRQRGDESGVKLIRSFPTINLVDGFRRHIGVDWETSEYEYYQPSQEFDALLFKLHGSVDWVRTPTGTIQRWEIGKRNPGGTKTEIVYPSLLKREIHEEPFRTNYDYLLACLLHAKLCVVIGFSFRDQEIVEEFRQAMGLNKALELMIIDPKAEIIKSHLETKLGFEPKVELIKEKFTIDNAESIADRIAAKVII